MLLWIAARWANGDDVLLVVYSPLNDLLEKDDFTLEQVLEEDELIQEVKTRNTKLLELYVLNLHQRALYCVCECVVMGY